MPSVSQPPAGRRAAPAPAPAGANIAPQPQGNAARQENAHARPAPAAQQSELCRKLPAARFFRAEKTYGHEAGFSCCFRQWRAEHSHCRFMHGYALAVRFSFVAQNLDKHGWVMDFGGLKPLKEWLRANFDHKILLAEDDPARAVFQNMAQAGLCAVNILPAVGCEAFAYYIWQHCDALTRQISRGAVRIETVRVCEHGGNAAQFTAENLFAAR